MPCKACDAEVTAEEIVKARPSLKEDLRALADIQDQIFYVQENPAKAMRARACKIYLEKMADEVDAASIEALTRYVKAQRSHAD